MNLAESTGASGLIDTHGDYSYPIYSHLVARSQVPISGSLIGEQREVSTRSISGTERSGLFVDELKCDPSNDSSKGKVEILELG